MNKKLTVVIPFWNGHDTLERLLTSIPLYDIIIVNDAGSAPPVSNRSHTRIINLRERGYFAGACNAGFSACDTDVLILNQDVWFDGEGWIRDIEAVQALGLGVYGHGVMNHPAWPHGYVQGTFMFISRETLDAVGDFNQELYPLWGGTAEFQLRACRAGFQAMPVEQISGMRHEERKRYGSSIEQALKDEPDKKAQFIRTPPEISVIVPCFNYGHYLHEMLDSLMRQTMQSFEVIIVDDNSTDGSREIARGLQNRWNGVRVIEHGGNMGTATAINSGVRRAYGKYITILSADDTLEPYSLERHYKGNLEHPHSFTYGDVFFVTKGKSTYVKMQEFDYDALLKRNHVPAGIMYPKLAWHDAGGYPDIMRDGREDWAFAIGLGRVGYCGQHVGQTGYNVRKEKQNRSLHNGRGRHNLYLDRIRKTYPDVYDGSANMPCCGRRGSNKVVKGNSKNVSAVAPGTGWILLTFTGKRIGTQSLWVPSGRKYKYGNTDRKRQVWVHPDDLSFVMDLRQFRVAKVMLKTVEAPAQEMTKAPTTKEALRAVVEKVRLEKPSRLIDPMELMSFVPMKSHATPGAMKVAQVARIDLLLVRGTGKDGRILKRDVEAYVQSIV